MRGAKTAQNWKFLSRLWIWFLLLHILNHHFDIKTCHICVLNISTITYVGLLPIFILIHQSSHIKYTHIHKQGLHINQHFVRNRGTYISSLPKYQLSKQIHDHSLISFPLWSYTQILMIYNGRSEDQTYIPRSLVCDLSCK